MVGEHDGATLLAGLDIGTTHTKAGVYRPDGGPVALRSAATPSDAVGLSDTALRLLAECVSAAPTPPVAVGIASMAETGVPLDVDGTPLGDLLHWRDRHAHREADQLAESVGWASLYATTGLYPSPKLPLARWIWLRRHEADRIRRMARWASSADLVLAALTGTVATSPTLAARTGAYDIRAGAYAPDLLDLAGLRADQMPEVVACDRVAGRVSRAAATRVGLPAGTPVVVAGHDHLVAAWAAGVRGPGTTADSMGTAEAVLTPVAELPPTPATPTGTSVAPFLDGRSYCLVSGLSSSGGLIDWWLRRFAPPDCPDRYHWFAALVGPPTGAPTGITVLPYLRGRASPRPDPHRALSVHGLRPEHGLADVGRALLEGLCMQVRWMLEDQTRISGHRPDAVGVFGGPAANRTWMAIKAAVMPVPVRVLPEHRSAALGAAQLAGRAVGVTDDTPTPPPPPAVPRDPAWEAAYRSRFLPLATTPDRPSPEEAP